MKYEIHEGGRFTGEIQAPSDEEAIETAELTGVDTSHAMILRVEADGNRTRIK